jgi:3-hydroxyacyl-[acyl-carrier-protein] dehydratase
MSGATGKEGRVMDTELIGLDRVTAVKPGERATALRNVPQTLSIFDHHFPRRPVLPGVLVLGCMGELAGVLLGEERRWRLVGAERVRYRHFIQPGDQMVIEVRLTELADGRAVLAGSVEVDGRLVTSARKLHMELRESS